MRHLDYYFLLLVLNNNYYSVCLLCSVSSVPLIFLVLTTQAKFDLSRYRFLQKTLKYLRNLAVKLHSQHCCMGGLMNSYKPVNTPQAGMYGLCTHALYSIHPCLGVVTITYWALIFGFYLLITVSSPYIIIC